jgi:hypothetical protein
MDIYNYNKEGVFLYSSKARLSPLDRKKVYLIPANATTKPPLDIPEGFVNVFNGKKWQAVEDHRGTVVYHKETKEQSVITGLGEIPEIYTTSPPKDSEFWNGDEWEVDPKRLKKLIRIKALDLESAALSKQRDAINSNVFSLATSLQVAGKTGTKLSEVLDFLSALWIEHGLRETDLQDNENLEVSLDFSNIETIKVTYSDLREEAGL